MARRIDPSQPNRILSAPATVEACAQDLRTPAQQQLAAAEARVQAGLARAHGQEAGGAPRGYRR